MKFALAAVLSAATVGVFALGACSAGSATHAAATTTPAAPSAPASTSTPLPSDAAVRKAIASLSPGTKIISLRAGPIPGLVEVMSSEDMVYVTTDGKYLLTGNIIDIASKRDLTEASRAAVRKDALSNLSPSQMIVFAPSHPKYTVTVFTDVDCGFCRKLHSQIADYNKAGIAVDYLFFPRTGIGSESYDKAVSVWCSADRRKALTDAKKGLPVVKANCTNPITMDYNLGLKVGVDGTPAIYTADGTQIGGYLTPAEMRAKLDELAAKPDS